MRIDLLKSTGFFLVEKKGGIRQKTLDVVFVLTICTTKTPRWCCVAYEIKLWGICTHAKSPLPTNLPPLGLFCKTAQPVRSPAHDTPFQYAETKPPNPVAENGTDESPPRPFLLSPSFPSSPSAAPADLSYLISSGKARRLPTAS